GHVGSNSQVLNQIEILSGSSRNVRLPPILCSAWLNYVLHVRRITATISGASSFGATATNFVSIAEGAAIGVQVVASSGAAASNLRVTLVIGY
ncbi:hypothetical protein, partial [Burkholderia gladioli]|uniref:hypothetical protein n=1 Tax=Burkholderia gladioli TaxID=28095 RepID=UPI001ABB9438